MVCGPEKLASAMPIAQCVAGELVTHSVPCQSSQAEQNHVSFKTKRSSALLQARCKTKIACWSICSLGALNDQSESLHAVFKTVCSREED